MRDIFQGFVHRSGFGKERIPDHPDQLHDLPEKLGNHKGQGNDDKEDGSQGKQGGQDVPKDFPPKCGKIHLFGYPLIDGGDQHIKQDGPEQDGEKGREKPANQNKEDNKNGPKNDILYLFGGRMCGIAHKLLKSRGASALSEHPVYRRAIYSI
jgi:hypothetical protein